MAAVDRLQTQYRTPEPPSTGAEEVTPDDATDLAYVTNQIYVGGTGNLQVLTLDGNDVTLVGLPSGAIVRIRAKRVKAEATTATNIVALH